MDSAGKAPTFLVGCQVDPSVLKTRRILDFIQCLLFKYWACARQSLGHRLHASRVLRPYAFLRLRSEKVTLSSGRQLRLRGSHRRECLLLTQGA